MELSYVAKSALTELEKLASSALELIKNHHDTPKKDWKKFEKNLKKKSFVKAVIEHPKSDDKLKKYVINYTDYLKSKKTVGKIKSRTSNKVYKIKKLSSGSLGCGCKDWQYVHSVAGTDCDHISKYKTSDLPMGIDPSSKPESPSVQ